MTGQSNAVGHPPALACGMARTPDDGGNYWARTTVGLSILAFNIFRSETQPRQSDQTARAPGRYAGVGVSSASVQMGYHFVDDILPFSCHIHRIEASELAFDEALDRARSVERVLLEHDFVALDERVRLHEDLPGLFARTSSV